MQHMTKLQKVTTPNKKGHKSKQMKSILMTNKGQRTKCETWHPTSKMTKWQNDKNWKKIKNVKRQMTKHIQKYGWKT